MGRHPENAVPAAAPALHDGDTVQWALQHRLGPGFAFRREAFGGILFHFEGARPDPRLTLVDSPFLVQLLEMVERAPLGELLAQAAAQFKLTREQEASMRRFFITLVGRAALVPA